MATGDLTQGLRSRTLCPPLRLRDSDQKLTEWDPPGARPQGVTALPVPGPRGGAHVGNVESQHVGLLLEIFISRCLKVSALKLLAEAYKYEFPVIRIF